MDDFDQFWASYPRKTAKKLARRAFDKAIKKTTITVMVEAIHGQLHTRQWISGYIPHPATWLNGERWNDELPAPALSERNARNIAAILGVSDDDDF